MAFTAIMDISASDSFLVAYNARQGESGEDIFFTVYDNGIPLAVSKVTNCTVKAETPLGHFIQFNATRTAFGCSFKTTENMNAEAGYFKRFYVEFTFTDGTKQTTPDIIYYVAPEANFTGGAGEDYVDKVQEIIDKINKLYAQLVIDLNDEFEKAVTELNEELQTAIDNFNNILNSFQTKVDAMEATLNTLDASIDALDTKLQEFLDKFGSSQPLFFRGKMADVDWNTLQTTNDRGIYYVGGIAASADKHTPIASGTLWGQLTVTVEGVVIQSYTDGATMYQRRLSGSPLAWSNWRKFLTDATGMNQLSLAMGADDWNNYTEIGTYGITTGTGANAPVNSTGTLLVQAYGTGGSGRTQVFINSSSIRYRQYQGGGNWTAWQTLSNLGNTDAKYMNINRTAVVAQDWNTLTTLGTYNVNGATGANRPSTSDIYGTLLVQGGAHDASTLTQMFIGNSTLLVRRKTTSTTWGAWRTASPAVANSEEIDAGTDNTKMITPNGLQGSKYNKSTVFGAWTNIPLNTGFKGGDSTTPKYRIIEYMQSDGTTKKYIEFDGAVTNDAGSIPSQSPNQQQWWLQAEQFRPAQTKMFPSQCSNFSTTGRVAFTTGGISYFAQNSGAAVTYFYITGMGYWLGE